MAKFEKGRSKTGGRKKGTPNYTTRLIKEKFLHEMGEYVDSELFHGDIISIPDPAKRLEMFLKMANYLLPKQSSVDSTINVKDESQQSVLDRLNQLAHDNEE